MSPEVTIAVVSWNTRELLRACLRSLESDQAAGRIAVVVVDNASSDGSAEMAQAEFPWVETIASQRNLGFGPAVNLAAERSSTPWIAPANADIEVTSGAVAALLEAGERDPGAGIVAPRLVLPEGGTQHSVHAFPTLLTSALLALPIARLSPRLADRLCVVGHWDDRRRRRVDWAHGAFLIVRRRAFDATGGFDPDQWMYAEDLDLAWRLRKAGWATRYEPTAAVRHVVSASTAKAWGDERSRRSMAASYAWIARRRGLSVARAVAAINVGGAVSRIAYYEIRARLGDHHRWQTEVARWRWHAGLHRLGLRSRRSIFRAR